MSLSTIADIEVVIGDTGQHGQDFFDTTTATKSSMEIMHLTHRLHEIDSLRIHLLEDGSIGWIGESHLIIATFLKSLIPHDEVTLQITLSDSSE